MESTKLDDTDIKNEDNEFTYSEELVKLKEENKNSSPEHVKYLNNVTGDMNVYENSIDDPTSIFDPSNSLLKYPKQDVITTQVDELKKKRILILESYSITAIEALSIEISKESTFKSLEKRILRFNNSNTIRADLSIDYFAQENNKKIRNTIFFVNINSVSERFSDSFFSQEASYQNSFSTAFSKRNIYIVCWIHLPETIEKISNNYQNLCFPKTQIPFLSYSVSNFLREDASSWVELIRQQREIGLWGENKSDKELYEQLEILKQGSKEKFKDVIIKLNQGLKKRLMSFINSRRLL